MNPLDELIAKNSGTELPVSTVDSQVNGNSTTDIGADVKKYLNDTSRQTYIRRFEEIYTTLGEENKSEIQELLNRIVKSSSDGEFERYWGELNAKYDAYILTHADIVDDTKTKTEFIPNEFLTQSDSVFYRHIRDKLATAESWSMDDILSAAKSIEIASHNIGAEEWDSFFEDLRDEIPASDIQDFNTFVNDFKTKNPELYDGSYTDTNIGVNIESISSGLDTILGDLENIPDGNQIMVPVGDLEVTFLDKKSAALFIYKVKLVLSELANNEKSLLAMIWGGVWGIQETGWGVGNASESLLDDLGSPTWLTFLGSWIATIAALTVLNLNLIGGPIESGFRNTKDFLTVRYGNNRFSKVFQWIGDAGKIPRKGVEALLINKIPLLGPIVHGVSKVVESGVGIVGSGGKTLFTGVEAHYVDPTTRGLNYVLLDGTQAESAGELSKNEEALRRAHVIEFFKQRWYFDQERLDLLNGLDGAKGVIVSDSETFWIRIWEIDQGQYFHTQTGATRRENMLLRGEGAGRKTLRVFSIPSFQEAVMKDYNNSSKRSVELLKFLFTDVNTPDKGQVSIDESKLSSDYKNALNFIGLSQSISDSEETSRKGYLKEMIEAIKNGKFLPTTLELKKEIARIAEGGYPKFKMLESLGNEIRITTDSSEVGRLRKLMEMIRTDKWMGDKSEFDIVVQDTKNGTFDFSEKKSTVKNNFDTITRKGKKLGEDIFSKDIAEQGDLLKYFQTERDIYAVTHTDTELGKLDGELNNFYGDLKKVDGKRKVDFTTGQVHFIFRRMLSGDSYQDASKAIVSETSDIETGYKNRDSFITRDIQNLVKNYGAIKDGDEKIDFFEKISKRPGMVESLVSKSNDFGIIHTDFLGKLGDKIDDEVEYLTDEKNRLLGITISGSTQDTSIRGLVEEKNGITNKIATLENRNVDVGDSITDKIKFYRELVKQKKLIMGSINNLNGRLIGAGIMSAPAAAAPAAAPSETPEETKTRFRGHLNKIALSVYSSGDEAAILVFERTWRAMNDSSSSIFQTMEKSGNIDTDLTRLFHSLGIDVTITNFDVEVAKSRILVDVSSITAADKNFAAIKDFNDLGAYIHGLTDTSLKGNIETVLRDLSVARK